MPFDFKKEYKEYYTSKSVPTVIDVPKALFIMVDGKGDPNNSAEFQNAVQLLYGLAYTIKMSKMSDTQPVGYHDFVVPPLEGLWELNDPSFKGGGKSITDKSLFSWTMMLRMPDFVTESVFKWAKLALNIKKPLLDLSPIRLEEYHEGLSVQVMHIGSFDDEAKTIMLLEVYVKNSGYAHDMENGRRHHEIYLSDMRKTAPDRLRTIIRHPIKEAGV